MLVGKRFRSITEQKNLLQEDIEKRTGLLRCYVSRAENGHTVPAVGTLDKLARALEIPRYQLSCEGNDPPARPKLPKEKTADEMVWGNSGQSAR